MATSKSKAKKNTVNKEIKKLSDIKDQMQSLHEAEDAIKKRILTSKKSAVVTFIDLVGSTKFKGEHLNEPEVWLLRLQLFVQIIKEYIELNGGGVVKIIGDEVMGIFEGPSCVSNSSKFLVNLHEIRKAFKSETEFPIDMKIAIDYGDVYLVKYDEHKSADPQGLVVDRCARISKFVTSGRVLSSYDFAEQANALKWSFVGKIALKGITGETQIYQFGESDILIEEMIEISKKQHEVLTKEIQELKAKFQKMVIDNNAVVESNRKLIEQLKAAKQSIDPQRNHSEEPVNEDSNTVERLIDSISSLVESAGVSKSEYARFLFLYMKGEGDYYNKFDRAFDRCIEANLVVEGAENEWSLNLNHKRNQKLIPLLKRLEEKLQSLPEPEEDLFDHSLKAPEYWSKYFGFTVT